MATAHHSGSTLREKLSWFTSRSPHRFWDRFSADQQERMVRDDLTAGTSVSLLLFALITTGLVLTVVTVLRIVASQ